MSTRVVLEELDTKEGLTKLYGLALLVFRKHFNIYVQYKDELIADAIVDCYSALEQYNPDFSLVVYLYTVCRNSFTKHVSKLNRIYYREESEFYTYEGKNYGNSEMEIGRDLLDEYVKRFRLNYKHRKLLVYLFEREGIRVKGLEGDNNFIYSSEDIVYLSRIQGMIFYDLAERGEVGE